MTDTTDATVQPHFGELLDGLRATFATGVTRPLAWRARQLDALQRFLAERESELVEAIQHDLGRPVAEAFGADIGHSRVHIKHTRKHFERWARPQRGSVGALSFPATAQGPGGVTATVLLAESHLCVHTWPEQQGVTVDVYVCNFGADHSAKAHALMDALVALFAPRQALRQALQRGGIPAML